MKRGITGSDKIYYCISAHWIIRQRYVSSRWKYTPNIVLRVTETIRLAYRYLYHAEEDWSRLRRDAISNGKLLSPFRGKFLPPCSEPLSFKTLNNEAASSSGTLDFTSRHCIIPQNTQIFIKAYYRSHIPGRAGGYCTSAGMWWLYIYPEYIHINWRFRGT